ncbi:MAG: hypothetical protein AVDCRST_MAG30-1147, partial [uncultured Solirubrobacteraceae bacterium]
EPGHRADRHRGAARGRVRRDARPGAPRRLGDDPQARQPRRRRTAARGLPHGPDPRPSRRALQGAVDAHRLRPAAHRHLGGPRPRRLLRPHDLPARRGRRERHPLRVRERVQGAGRLPRRRGEPRARRRHLRAGGEGLARAAQEAARAL